MFYGNITNHIQVNHHIVIRGGVVAKCHSTTGNQLKADKLGGQTKQSPDKKFKVMVKGHFSFVSFFHPFLKGM